MTSSRTHAAPGPVQSRALGSAARALAVSGLCPVRPLRRLPSTPGHTGRHVLRATVSSAAGIGEVAVTVTLDPTKDAANSARWEHRVARTLSGIADDLVGDGVIARNPIVRVLHDTPIDAGDALVSIARFLPRSVAPLTAHDWGYTLGLLHVIGSTDAALDLLATRRGTNALAGLRADALLHALRRPDHPFGHDQTLVRDFARIFAARAVHALRLDPTPLLIHRDLHTLNCIPTADGAVAIDWQEAGWGNRSDDWAWTYLAVNRFAAPPRILAYAKRGYALAAPGSCPSNDQIAASGRLRELLCLGYSIQNAYRSAEHLRECHTELPILADPHARTGTWKLLHNPAVLTPGLAP